MYGITLSHSFEAAHRVATYDGKCSRVHGHNYEAHAEIQADGVGDDGFVIDAGDFKKLLDRYDHRLLLSVDDPLTLGVIEDGDHVRSVAWGEDLEEQYGVVRVPFTPTTELFAMYLAAELRTVLLTRGALSGSVTLTLRETAKIASTVEVKWSRTQGGIHRSIPVIRL